MSENSTIKSPPSINSPINRLEYKIQKQYILSRISPPPPVGQASRLSIMSLIRNIITSDLNSLEGRRDSGSLVENSVFLMLLTGKGPLDEIYYWRTKAGAEMDFFLKEIPG